MNSKPRTSHDKDAIILRSLKKRHAKEKRFRFYGLAAISIAGAMLALLMISLLIPGIKGVFSAHVTLPVSPLTMMEKPSPDVLIKQSWRARFPDVTSRRDKRALNSLSAPHAHSFVTLPDTVQPSEPHYISFPLSSNASLWVKSGMHPEEAALYGISEQQVKWLTALDADDAINVRFNTGFFSEGDSRDPEKAGFLGAALGSLFLVIVCLAVSLPVGVGAAIYLEEFAPRSAWRDFVEVNINNLAAIPSIIFGLLGLFVYLSLFGLPRSSALVGGLTLALLTLPIIIIASRSALAAVPDTLRDAARALGASPLQVVLHHVLPQALPGIMTGTILGIARALGETAPLLMIGMVAFIATPPGGFTDPTTAMPVQIYLWASSPEQGFVEKTASGILVLILLLLCLNLTANYIRNRASRHHG